MLGFLSQVSCRLCYIRGAVCNVPYPLLPVALSPGVKPRREADSSPLSFPSLRMTGATPPFPPYAFIDCTLINLALYFIKILSAACRSHRKQVPVLRLTQSCAWGFNSNGIWRCVTEQSVSDVSNYHSAFIFKGLDFREEFFLQLFRNVDNRLANDAASYPRRVEPSSSTSSLRPSCAPCSSTNDQFVSTAAAMLSWRPAKNEMSRRLSDCIVWWQTELHGIGTDWPHYCRHTSNLSGQRAGHHLVDGTVRHLK
jgi:hypothetical protein